MKKQKYSLTSKERKNLRDKEAEKNTTEENVAAVAMPTDVAAVKPPKMSRKNFIMSVIGIVLGIAFLLTAILLPLTCNRYYMVDNPVARIELSNGMALEFEIYEESCPIAATNFIFLAKYKFFDHTMIFDIQNDWVRFGDYETLTTLRSDNEKFMKSLPGFYEGHKDNKLGYRLKADSSSDAGRHNEEGMLTFNYNNSSNQFFISGNLNCSTKIEGSSSDYKPTTFGRYLNDETLANIKAIAALPRTSGSTGTIWKGPAAPILIKTVKIYNLDGKKWNKFHFEDYMNTVGSNSTSAFTSWYDK